MCGSTRGLHSINFGPHNPLMFQGCARRKNLSHGRTKKEHKQAIKHFFNEVKSAGLPDINQVKDQFSSVGIKKKSQAASNERKIEFIHEEYYDS